MPSPSHPVASVHDRARLCVNPAFPAETDVPSRTVAHTQTALLPPYPPAVRELPVRVAGKWLAPGVLATIEAPVVIRKILTHLGLPTQAPAPQLPPADLFDWN